MAIRNGAGYVFDTTNNQSTIGIEKDFADMYDGGVPLHPFKIINVGLRVSGGVTSVTYQVYSGSINNLVPIIDDYVSGTEVKLDRVTSGVTNPPTGELVSSNFNATTKTSYISIRSGPKTASPYTYPDDDVTSNGYPIIVGGSTAPATPDSDTYGYLVIGTITVDNITTPTTFTVSQNVTGSLWADRIKLAGSTARYFYARI